MKINEVMTREPRAVRVLDRLDAAARVLWDLDCGIVPVVDAAGALVGVVTDRDLCMAAFTQGRLLTDIPVSAVMARSVRSCRPDDSIATVLQTMAQAQVHRLPVVDAKGALVGIVSTSDLVRAANGRPAAVDVATVVKTLAAIAAPRRTAAIAPAPAPAAAPAKAAASPMASIASVPPAVIKPATAAAATAPASKPGAVKPGTGKPAPKKAKGKKG